MKAHWWLGVMAVLFAFVPGISAQTCTISSPANGALFQSPEPLRLTATVSAASTAYKLIWSVDYQRYATGYNADQHPTFNDSRDEWKGPFTATWYTGLNGDGTHTISGIVYNIFGGQLATCPPVTFTVRIEGMSNQSFNALPNQAGNTISGTGKWGALLFDGSAQAQDYYVDGYPMSTNYNYCGRSGATSETGGAQLQNFNTTCFRNGQRLLQVPYNINGISDPYLLPLTISSVSGNNIVLASNHYAVQSGNTPNLANVATFSNTGGSLPAPLVAGCSYFSKASPTNSKTASYSISGGVITVTLSSGCSLAPGVPVFLRNIQYNRVPDGVPVCDGLYTMATGSGTTFTVASPAGCPDGITGIKYFEVDIYPYFVSWQSPTSVSLSTDYRNLTGTAVALTSAGSGTSTFLQRIRSPYYGLGDAAGQNLSGPDSGGPAYVSQVVTFSNGAAPMELYPKYWEMHLIAGASPTALCNAGTLIHNTDGSFTSTNCSSSVTTGLSWTEVDDGGLSGVCSVDNSGNVTPIMAGWCQIQVACVACAAGGVTLQPVTVYVQVHSGSITYPHFTHNGQIANSFSPGSSFFPLSAWQLNPVYATPYQTANARPLWEGPMMQESNLNTFLIAPDPSNTAFGNPASSTCASSTWPSTYHQYEMAFAAQYGLYYEADMEPTHWGANGPVYIAAFLNNSVYNRQNCFTGWLSALVSEGRTYRTYSYDELNQYMAGSYPFRNPNLGSTDFPSIVVSSGVATYNVAETFTGPWNQAAGTGSWVKVAGAVTNACLNGWFPVTAITSTGGYPVSFTTPTPCGNGTYTESVAQLYHYWAGGGVGENVAILPRLLGTSAAAGGSAAYMQHWDATYFTQIVVSGCNGTICSAEFYMPSHGIANNQAIRVFGSVNHLNVVAPTTLIDSSHFSITYQSLFGTLPSNGTYTSSNDAGLYITVDGNLPPTPFMSLRNVITSVTGHPATTWSMIGLSYSVGNPAVYNWTGNPIGEDAVDVYIPNPITPYLGVDGSVFQWAHYASNSSNPGGLATRAFELPARGMLFSAGPDVTRYCQKFGIDLACDHPKVLDWRPETMVAQLIGMLTLNISSLRGYNFGAPGLDFNNCCGLSSPGTGLSPGITPFTTPKQWSAMARTFALIKLREDTELQPSANKPYMGQFFMTDAHRSATYGNELKILCADEMPYGSQTVALPAISGGSMLKYILTGYSLSVSTLAGNPSTDTDEFCSSPGRTTTYVALPPSPAVNPMDNITFAPPSPLPFGAFKFLLQVGYYPRAMQDDPVTDCTSACSIAIDHHNTAAWYRVIYADSNNLPLSVGDPVKIASQGLY